MRLNKVAIRAIDRHEIQDDDASAQTRQLNHPILVCESVLDATPIHRSHKEIRRLADLVCGAVGGGGEAEEGERGIADEAEQNDADSEGLPSIPLPQDIEVKTRYHRTPDLPDAFDCGGDRGGTKSGCEVSSRLSRQHSSSPCWARGLGVMTSPSHGEDRRFNSCRAHQL